jgi:hypothetical protein
MSQYSTCAEKHLVYEDSDTENINSDVVKIIENGVINRIIAGIEIEFSNSLGPAQYRT